MCPCLTLILSQKHRPDFYDHFVELKDHVTVEETMTLLSHVNAVHYEVYPEQKRPFSMELIQQLLKDERIKGAKSLIIEIVAHTPWEILVITHFPGCG